MAQERDDRPELGKRWGTRTQLLNVLLSPGISPVTVACDTRCVPGLQKQQVAYPLSPSRPLELRLLMSQCVTVCTVCLKSSECPNLCPLRKHVGFGYQQSCLQIRAPLPLSCDLGQVIKLFEPQFSPLYNGGKSICLSGIIVRIKWDRYVKW